MLLIAHHLCQARGYHQTERRKECKVQYSAGSNEVGTGPPSARNSSILLFLFLFEQLTVQATITRWGKFTSKWGSEVHIGMHAIPWDHQFCWDRVLHSLVVQITSILKDHARGVARFRFGLFFYQMALMKRLIISLCPLSQRTEHP